MSIAAFVGGFFVGIVAQHFRQRLLMREFHAILTGQLDVCDRIRGVADNIEPRILPFHQGRPTPYPERIYNPADYAD